MRVCAITNVLDEFFNLPIWLEHYGRELGPENCIIVDRGSKFLPPLQGQSVLQTHRRPLNDTRRAQTIASLVNNLLDYYDVVLYSDCDELLTSDPAQYSGLIDFFQRNPAPAYTASGVDLVHKLDEEDPLDPGRRLLGQRSYCVFNSWMCKTLATREKIGWSAGFHASTLPPVFNGLYLFHTRMADCGERLKRAAQLRSFEWADGENPSYHHFPPLFSVKVLLAQTGYDVGDFDTEIGALTEQALGSARKAEDGLYYLTEDLRPERLLKIPERFRGAL